jgi:membrane protein implicated in regulation of membrane protease activity
MSLFFVPVPFWWPLGLGLLLMMGELLVPATVFLWTGISCVLTGLALALAPGLPLYAALLLWIALSVAAILTAKHLHHRQVGLNRVEPSMAPNQYGSEFVGMTASLGADSEHGLTRLNLSGASWGVKLPGGDLKAGDRVRITAVDGIYLVAEPV